MGEFTVASSELAKPRVVLKGTNDGDEVSVKRNNEIYSLKINQDYVHYSI